MTEYRIYPLDQDGRIQAPSVVANCADDNGALASAYGSLEGGAQAEVWAGTRCLGRVCRNVGGDQRQDCRPPLDKQRAVVG